MGGGGGGERVVSPGSSLYRHGTSVFSVKPQSTRRVPLGQETGSKVRQCRRTRQPPLTAGEASPCKV